MTKDKFFTLPNGLTLLRMALVPVLPLVYFLWHPHAGLLVYGLACLTDVLDGWLARRLNQVSTFGKWADPLADKLMVQTVVTCLAIDGRAWMWVIAGVLFVKEGLMVVGAFVYYYGKQLHLVFEAAWIGKLATSLMFAGIILCFFDNRLAPWHMVVMGAGLAASLSAFFYYLVHNVRTVRQTLAARTTPPQKTDPE